MVQSVFKDFVDSSAKHKHKKHRGHWRNDDCKKAHDERFNDLFHFFDSSIPNRQILLDSYLVSNDRHVRDELLTAIFASLNKNENDIFNFFTHKNDQGVTVLHQALVDSPPLKSVFFPKGFRSAMKQFNKRNRNQVRPQIPLEQMAKFFQIVNPMVMLWVAQCLHLAVKTEKKTDSKLTNVNMDFEPEHYEQMVNILQSTDPRGNTPLHYSSQSVLATFALLYPVVIKFDWSTFRRALFEIKNKDGKSAVGCAPWRNRLIYRTLSSKNTVKTLLSLLLVVSLLFTFTWIYFLGWLIVYVVKSFFKLVTSAF